MSLKAREETIILDYPVQLADRVLETVTIKRPSMKVIKQYPIKGSQDIDGEMKLMCALTCLRMEEMEEIDAADYARLQDIYVRFRSPSNADADTRPDA